MNRSSWLGFGLAAILFFILGWVLHSVRHTGNAQSSVEKPAAAIGSELVYEKDYLPALEADIQRIRMTEYEARRKGLEAVISRRLVNAEAARRGMKDEELLRQEVDSHAQEPDESTVERAWVQQMFQGGQFNNSKDQIREKLKQEQIAGLREEFFAV